MDSPETIAAAFWLSFWEAIGDTAFFIVVVFLAVEFVAARFAKPHREALDNARELRIAQLTKDASRLSAEATLARAEIAEADSRAQRARRDTAKLQLELEKFRAPRLPTEQQLALLTERLKPFKGTVFDTGLAPNDKEQEDFLWRLEPAIAAAGWMEIGWMSPVMGAQLIRRGDRPISGPVAVTNVSIQMHRGHEAKFQAAANALVSALKEIGIEAQVDWFNIHNMNDEAMHVMIGRKQ